MTLCILQRISLSKSASIKYKKLTCKNNLSILHAEGFLIIFIITYILVTNTESIDKSNFRGP